ncbi:MAG: hypothetical protein IJS17_06360 [Clostridia bacterium]|nr:hypothetical protein [Clostridia bacterium]
MKKIISIMICVCVLLACVIPAVAITPVSAKVYEIYQNNMIFKQNDDAVLAGTAPDGSVITCLLYDKAHNLVTSSETVADNGVFKVSFTAPKGSFEEYTIVLKEGSMTFKTLTGVVFGELWLASGQSNMELNMDLCSTWEQYQKNGYGSRWVRILTFPNFPVFKDSETTVPLYPQNDVPGALWARACDENIEKASAVANYFAHKLMTELNVPVGILNASLGATKIESWISRENIENDERALAIAKENDSYWTYEGWVDHSLDDVESVFHDYVPNMGVNFNARLSPIRNFRISGMIWYQGEANMGYKSEDYTYLLNLLQKQNGETFGYTNGKLPLIYSQLASYDYNMEKSMQYFNFGLSKFQKEDPQSRACISIYDLPLTFKQNYHTIHPLDKEPVGVRMAENALVMVYGRDGIYSAPTFTSAKIRDNEVYVTIDNVGDGLIAKDGDVRGFALCGEDGVYYRADAQIIDKNIVKVTSKSVEEPVCVTYAYSYLNDRANLYSACKATVGMPVSPFISNPDYDNKNTYRNTDWADCESEQLWNMAYPADRSNDNESGFYDAWNSSFCTKKIVSYDQYNQNIGLNLKSIGKFFTLKHKFTSKKFAKDEVFFTNQERDFSKFGALTFMVRNNGLTSVEIRSKIETADTWYNTALNGSANSTYVIPNDGQWHEVEMNFAVLFEKGNSGSIRDGSALGDVRSFEIQFTSGLISANVDVDEFNFMPSATLEDNNAPVSRNIFQKIFDFFKNLFWSIF